MAARPKAASPVLGAAMTLIGDAGDALITRDSPFRHTFEAQVDRIRPDPGQPRKVFAEEEVAALAATMAEQGQLQPVLLRRDPEQRGSYVLVAGERRWRAALLNKWQAILAIDYDGDPDVAGLIENLQRVDLTPVEEARGLQRLIEGKEWSQAKAAEVLGRTKGEISATLRILTLPQTVLERVLTSELDIPRNALVELARIEDPDVRDQLVSLARAGTLTIRAIRSARQIEEQHTVGTRERNGQSTETQLPGRPDGEPLAPARFSFRALEQIAIRLRNIRETGRPVRPVDRERLEALRQEIDALLGSAS